MKFLIPLILLLILNILTAKAQPTGRFLDPDKRLEQYICENWTTDDGLPTNSLLHLCQTNDGYLWISGYNGLVRFDGIKFDVFNKTNTAVFKTDIIRKLAQDKEGRLWMTSQGSGLLSYYQGKFEQHGEKEKIKHLYRALLVDKANRVWSASPDKGWFVYEDGYFRFLTHSSNLANIEVRAIIQGKSGEIWFGTMGEGLYCFKNGDFTVFSKKDGLSNQWVYSLLMDKTNRIWIGTGNGVCIYEEGKIKPVALPVNATINSILEDDYGNIWLGSNNGLMRFNSKTGTVEWLSTKNGLHYNFINDMAFDFEGTLWLSNYKGGLARIKDGKFTNYTQRSGLQGKVVNAICEQDKQNLLIAFDNGLLSTIHGGKIDNFNGPYSLNGKRIRHILRDKNENLWFSTYSGLLKLGKNKKETWFEMANGFPDNQIRLCFEDSRGNIWIGTRNAGLVGKMNNESIQVYNISKGLSSNLIMAIEEDLNGSIFIGTSEGNGGLNILSPNGELNKIAPHEGFSSDVVFNICCDSLNNVWIATDGGLYHYKNEKFTLISTIHGLSDDSPYDVLEDNSGCLWMPCSSGIMKIKKSEALKFIQGESDKIHCVLYDKSDGMNQAECNPTTQSLKTSDGSLLFATIDGLSQINPSNILFNNYIPPVTIEGLEVDKAKVEISKSLEFKPGKRRYTFFYTALSLYEPDKMEFKYKLEGYEDDWVTAGGSRSVSYTNLPKGNYSFRVIASNNDGVWNNQGALLSFRIRPHFYETAWFYGLLVVFLFVSVYLFYWIRLGQLKRKQIRLEKIIRDRTREIIAKNEALQQQKNEIELKNTELLQQKEEILVQAEQLEEQQKELKASNAMKDKMFSIIAHDLRGPLGNFKSILDMALRGTETLDSNKQRGLLNMLSEMAQSTFELLENLLNWSVSQRGLSNPKPELFLIDPLLEEVIQLSKHQADKKNIEIRSSVFETITVFADINMVRTIFRNLLGNAIKFTPENGEIQIFSSDAGDFIKFGIRDTGIGISAENQKKLFNHLEYFSTSGTNREKGSGLGLMLCKDFVLKNGGTIWADSNTGEGSTFYFTLQKQEMEKPE